MSLLSKLVSSPSGFGKKQRLGRGRGSGRGGTSTKGHKGQKARSGCSLPNGFEGGQMSLARRLPKFGFTNKRFQKKWDVVNVGDLSQLSDEGNVDLDILYKAGRVRKNILVKVLGNKSVRQALHVKVHAVSKGAKEQIEKAGGRVEIIK